MLIFHTLKFLAPPPRPTPKLEDDPMSAVRDCFHSYPPYLEAISYIGILTTRRAVVTRDLLNIVVLVSKEFFCRNCFFKETVKPIILLSNFRTFTAVHLSREAMSLVG
jgi:hypothetical protein